MELFQKYIEDFADRLACNDLLFADNVKLIAFRRQQHELRASGQKALSWSCKWNLPLNARKSYHLSIGRPHNFCLPLSEEDRGESMQKFEYINNMGIAVNSAFTSSANVLTAANKAGGMLYFIKRIIFMYHTSNTPSKQSPLTQKGHIPPRKNTPGRDKVGERA